MAKINHLIADSLIMRLIFIILILVNFNLVASPELTISGKVSLTKGCSNKAMVWLALDTEKYQERLLLLHTEVPQNGTFEFYVRPGSYEVRASDQAGCAYLKKFKIQNTSELLNIAMKKQ